jgi:hypothetical protein
MATYRRYSVDNVDDVKRYGDFDAYFKCKDIDISFDEYVKPRIMRAIDLSDKDLSGTNNLFTNMCAVVDSLKVMRYNYNKAMDANRYNRAPYQASEHCGSFDAHVAYCYVDLYNQLSDDNYVADYNLYASMKAASDDVVLSNAGFEVQTVSDVVNTKFPDKVWMVDETFSTLHLWIYNYELDCHLITPDYEEIMDDNLIYYTPSKMADDVDYYRLMQDSAMFHDWQRRLDESSRKVLNLPSELEDESEKEF